MRNPPEAEAPGGVSGLRFLTTVVAVLVSEQQSHRLVSELRPRTAPWLRALGVEADVACLLPKELEVPSRQPVQVRLVDERLRDADEVRALLTLEQRQRGIVQLLGAEIAAVIRLAHRPKVGDHAVTEHFFPRQIVAIVDGRTQLIQRKVHLPLSNQEGRVALCDELIADSECLLSNPNITRIRLLLAKRERSR